MNGRENKEKEASRPEASTPGRDRCFTVENERGSAGYESPQKLLRLISDERERWIRKFVRDIDAEKGRRGEITASVTELSMISRIDWQ